MATSQLHQHYSCVHITAASTSTITATTTTSIHPFQSKTILRTAAQHIIYQQHELQSTMATSAGPAVSARPTTVPARSKVVQSKFYATSESTAAIPASVTTAAASASPTTASGCTTSSVFTSDSWTASELPSSCMECHSTIAGCGKIPSSQSDGYIHARHYWRTRSMVRATLGRS